jgi:NAD(P)H dehydrogenase (quinone)
MKKKVGKALIVLAHPEPLSLNAALTKVAVETLTGLGVEVDVSDLYAQGFQAVAGREDFAHLESPERLGYVHEQRHASIRRGYADDILREQDRLAAADLVIFQFPLWWYAVPAILKGWTDRVLTHGFAYTEENLFQNGLLRGKQAMLSVTTGGTAQELQEDSVYTGTIDEILKPFSGGVLRFVGMEVAPAHIFYAPASVTPEQRVHGIDVYRRRVLGLVERQEQGRT